MSDKLPHIQDRIWRDSVTKVERDLKHFHDVSPSDTLSFADIAKQPYPIRLIPPSVAFAGKPSAVLGRP